MSQDPYSPLSYGTPGYSASAAADPRAPARRASITMFVLAGLALACGVLVGVMAAVVSPQMFANTPQGAQFQQLEAQAGISFQAILGVGACMVAAPGILFLVLAFFVRGGRTVPVVLSLVLTCLLMLGIAVEVVVGLVQGGVQGGQGLLGAMCVFGIPMVLCVLILVWLVQALRNASSVAAMSQQYQMQMWQMQQQQQAYQQGAYGYPAQPPPQAGAGYEYGYGGYPEPQAPQNPQPPGESQAPPEERG